MFKARFLKSILTLFVFCAFSLFSQSVFAQSVLEDINVEQLPGEKLLVKLHFTEPVARPEAFTIKDPARITLDFSGAKVDSGKLKETVNLSILRTINAVSVGNRSRVVINLHRLVAFNTEVEGNTVRVILDTHRAAAGSGKKSYTFHGGDDSGRKTHSIRSIDFRRNEKGAGQVIIDLSDADSTIDIKERANKLNLTFLRTRLPGHLAKKLDVLDFGTPVKMIQTYSRGSKVLMSIEAFGDYDQITYQIDRKLIIEFKPLTSAEKKLLKEKKFAYKGERLSLNFQNISVRAALLTIAQFANFDLTVDDTVRGDLSLRLHSVPWDQALDVILRVKSLDKRHEGNVMIIGPAAQMAEYEKQRLRNRNEIVSLAPLRTEYIQINYANASKVAELLKSEKNSLLSDRGSVTVDERTNTLLVNETSDKMRQIYQLIDKIDVPIRQILIDARVVNASKNFEQDLGIKWGTATQIEDVLSGNLGIASSSTAARTLADGGNLTSAPFNVNLPTTGVTQSAGALPATLGLAFAKLAGGTLLDLELSALEAENKGRIVSSPRVVTANQKEAHIEKGEEIPYAEATSSGAASVSFKKATLSLTVKPQITPDDRVILDLKVTQDTRGVLVGTVPAINTNRISSQVLVDNGQTVVLGGVYEQNVTKTITRIPFLGHLPFVGALFRRKNDLDTRSELLIFITPKILADHLASR